MEEFGLQCEGKEIGRTPAQLKQCHPAGDYLWSIEGYAEFFAALKPAGQVFLFTIAGPTCTNKELSLSDQPTIEIFLDGMEGKTPTSRPAAVVAWAKGCPASASRP